MPYLDELGEAIGLSEEQKRRAMQLLPGLSEMRPPALAGQSAVQTGRAGPAMMGEASPSVVSSAPMPRIPSPATARMPSALPGLQPAPEIRPELTGKESLPESAKPIDARKEPGSPAAYRMASVEAERRPELHGWKKVLDIAGQIALPGLEARIPGTPGYYDWRHPQRVEEAQQGLQREMEGRRYESELSTAETQRKHLEAQTEKALADARKTPSAPEKREDIYDWMEARNLPDTAENREKARNAIALRGKAGETHTETDKYVRDWLATRKLPDTPENRQKARSAYIRETKIDPAQVRVEGFAETRGPTVTDKTTGVTAPMSWAEYNKLSRQFPGRYVAPQFDPETQMGILAWRDVSKGKTKDQITSYDVFLRHTGDLWDAVDSFSRTGSPWLNRPLNELRRQGGGNPQIQAFLAKLDPVQKEFQSFLLNNRALYEDDRKLAQRILNENMTPDQMRAALSSMAHTGDARLQALNESFKRATGEDIPSLYSTPSKEVLQKLGVPQRTSLASEQIPSATEGKEIHYKVVKGKLVKQ